MNESIVWLYQREAQDINTCGVKAAELAQQETVPAGFVIHSAVIAAAKRSGRLPLDVRDEILHAYHRLIIFGGTYLPFVKISASPLTDAENIPSPIILQLGGRAVLSKVEEMINSTDAGLAFAILVQQREPVLRLRPYTMVEQDRCLSIFRSNLPTYFHPGEERAFVEFLSSPNCPYFVAERGGEIVGCGGFSLDTEAKKATLVWGIVRNDRLKSGVGSFLLLSRLQAIAIQCTSCIVYLDTSQHSAPFFEKFGFALQNVTENYYGAGLHRYDMMLEMNEERRRWIAQNLGKYSE